MKKQAKCINSKALECEQSVVFYFMRVARWVAFLLLVGIGVMGALLQFQRHQDINWMFVSVCIACGVGLFWVGHCIMKSECATRKRCGTCNKSTTVGNITIRQV
ncbi:hypothetical protein SAMN05660964_02492 [Thiothrix caldifontis]|uniref:Uncharacterized protein n=1 Tax=Thiothrix caldifontis TaxID=525918 RepID=A0A1H4E775_9GAMM|nr:hypothetical protein [Thiothrix caldifontis]SEA80895.1 hypothetical protein SAMN05660964_02492 [Thiothrix caldifontis]